MDLHPMGVAILWFTSWYEVSWLNLFGQILSSSTRERFQTLKCCNPSIFSLTFAVLSYFQSRPANQSVQEGDEASFHCGAMGNPTPKISWFKDGRSVGTGNTLSFVAFRNRSGEYWCSAHNGLGSAINASARLNVQSKYEWVAFGTNV